MPNVPMLVAVVDGKPAVALAASIISVRMNGA